MEANINNSNGSNLIFLISQPRSGSTMLQLMLSGHPDIATTSEPWIALHPFFALRESGIDTRYNSTLAQGALKEFLAQSDLDENFYKKQVAHFLNAFYQKAIAHQHKRYFLDKTPRYYLIIDELMETFPEAKFIFLIRHPVAVLNSMIKTWAEKDLRELGSLRDDLLLAPRLIVDAYNQYSKRSCFVKYEDLVRTPSTLLNTICDYIGIDYSENMLDYGNRRPDWKYGDPIGIHKNSSPVVDSLKSWEEGFNSAQLNLLLHSYLEDVGKEIIDTVGYDYNDIISKVPKYLGQEPDKFISYENIMEYNHLLKERDLLRERINALRNSLSWKLTKPLRSILHLISK